VNFYRQISAGELFDLLRPAALVVSALLSTWVLASARRRRFRLPVAVAWALGTFFLTLVVLPLYLILRGSAKRRAKSIRSKNQKTPEQPAESRVAVVRFRFAAPVVYAAVLLSLIGLYMYRDHNSIDAHLARAEQAKVVGQREKAIREYRAALALEDNAHTHKLLGIELADAGNGSEALSEFRAAERGGEPDDSLSFRIGQALDAGGQPSEAVLEYKNFLNSHACTQTLPDERCETARRRVQLGQSHRER
jgi:tetratricopeptide (TPR) repeat protein